MSSSSIVADLEEAASQLLDVPAARRQQLLSQRSKEQQPLEAHTRPTYLPGSRLEPIHSSKREKQAGTSATATSSSSLAGPRPPSPAFSDQAATSSLTVPHPANSIVDDAEEDRFLRLSTRSQGLRSKSPAERAYVSTTADLFRRATTTSPSSQGGRSQHAPLSDVWLNERGERILNGQVIGRLALADGLGNSDSKTASDQATTPSRSHSPNLTATNNAQGDYVPPFSDRSPHSATPFDHSSHGRQSRLVKPAFFAESFPDPGEGCSAPQQPWWQSTATSRRSRVMSHYSEAASSNSAGQWSDADDHQNERNIVTGSHYGDDVESPVTVRGKTSPDHADEGNNQHQSASAAVAALRALYMSGKLSPAPPQENKVTPQKPVSHEHRRSINSTSSQAQDPLTNRSDVVVRSLGAACERRNSPSRMRKSSMQSIGRPRESRESARPLSFISPRGRHSSDASARGDSFTPPRAKATTASERNSAFDWDANDWQSAFSSSPAPSTPSRKHLRKGGVLPLLGQAGERSPSVSSSSFSVSSRPVVTASDEAASRDVSAFELDSTQDSDAADSVSQEFENHSVKEATPVDEERDDETRLPINDTHGEEVDRDSVPEQKAEEPSKDTGLDQSCAPDQHLAAAEPQRSEDDSPAAVLERSIETFPEVQKVPDVEPASGSQTPVAHSPNSAPPSATAEEESPADDTGSLYSLPASSISPSIRRRRTSTGGMSRTASSGSVTSSLRPRHSRTVSNSSIAAIQRGEGSSEPFARDVLIRGWTNIDSSSFASSLSTASALRRGARGYVTFEVVLLTIKGPTIRLHQRYSAFESLRKSLAVEIPRHAKSLPTLPPKDLLHRGSAKRLEARRIALQEWLRAVALDHRWGGTQALRQWVAG
ncbi:unnamed protein product [Jaminaea pallidilutea]